MTAIILTAAWAAVFAPILLKGLTEPVDDLSRDGTERRRFVAPVRSFHSATSSPEAQRDHA